MKQEPDLEKLLKNMTREAKLNYEKTKNEYWLGRYYTSYEIYHLYLAKKIEEKNIK